MWHSEEEIRTDLASGNSSQVAEAIHALKTRIDVLDEFRIPPLNVSILEVLCDELSRETQLALLDVITTYNAFSPPLSDADKLHFLTKLLLKYGDAQVALQVILFLHRLPNPSHAVASVLDEMMSQGLKGLHSVQGAKHFVGFLVDGPPPIRATLINALSEWPNNVSSNEVIESIAHELNAQELDTVHFAERQQARAQE